MSFGQEIKDFLGAAQSTYKALDDAQYSKIKRAYLQAQTDELSSPTRKAQQEANLAQTQESTRKLKLENDDPLRDETTKATNALRREQAGYYGARARALTAPPSAPQTPIADSIGAPPARPALTAPPAIGPQSALEPDQDDIQPTSFAAAGGLVEDDDEDDDALPAPVPAVGPTDVSAQSRPKISQDAAHDAVIAGLKYGASQVGSAGVPTPQRQQRLQALAQGAGAASPEEMAAIYKKIDPNNEMGDSERSLAALSAVYQYKLRAGDGAGAQRAAFNMLQHYRLASQRYAAIAVAAAEHGDIDGAAKAAMKAYANIPDGKDFKLAKTPDGRLSYSFTDEKTGKVINQGIASPQQLAAAAMGVATKGFDTFLFDAAGQRHAAKGAVGGEKGGPPKPTEAADLRDAISSQVDKLVSGSKDKSKITDSEISAMNNVAYHISRSNDVTPEEATTAALSFIKAPERKKDKDGKGGGIEGVEIKRDEDTGKNVLSFAETGRDITLSDAELRPLMVLRGKALKERTDAEAKPKGKSYGEYASEAGQAIGNVAGDAGKAIGAIGDAWGGAVSRDVKKFGQESADALERAKELNPALTSSVKRAIGAVQNPGDVPGVDNPL